MTLCATLKSETFTPAAMTNRCTAQRLRSTPAKSTWLTKLVAGDHEAFAEFVDKYKETVFLCCKTLGLHDAETDDVASETFLAAYKALKRYRGDARLSTWLWSIAYRRAVNFLRKKTRRNEIEGGIYDHLAAGHVESPQAGVIGSEESGIVWNAVRQLPRPWAAAIVLYYREEKSVKEISEVMGVGQNTIKTYLFRARRRLAETLAPILGEGVAQHGQTQRQAG